MTLEQLTELFKWMTIINIGIFIISSVLSMVFRRIVCTIHGKLFGLEEDKVSLVVYGYFGVYKIAILVFNLVPYISLLLIK